MATSRKDRGTPGFIGDSQSPDAIRRQFITDPAAATIQPGLSLGRELMALMQVLPEAFAQSQARELARLKRQGKAAEERVQTLGRAMAQGQALAVTAQRGRARVERLLEAALRPERGFHGFVSAADGEPLAGAQVRLVPAGKERAQALEARSGDDGYFFIRLPAAKTADDGPATRSKDAESKEATSVPARVEIRSSKGTLLHEDPAPVELASGSPYREYLIEPGGEPAPSPKAPGAPKAGTPIKAGTSVAKAAGKRVVSTKKPGRKRT